MATREQIRIAARGMYSTVKLDHDFERAAPIVKSAYEEQAKAALDALKKSGWKLTR